MPIFAILDVCLNLKFSYELELSSNKTFTTSLSKRLNPKLLLKYLNGSNLCGIKQWEENSRIKSDESLFNAFFPLTRWKKRFKVRKKLWKSLKNQFRALVYFENLDFSIIALTLGFTVFRWVHDTTHPKRKEKQLLTNLW